MYTRSNDIIEKILKISLQSRRTKGIHYGLYSLLWNSEQSQKQGVVQAKILKRKKELEKCIAISEVCRDTYRNKAYREKLN